MTHFLLAEGEPLWAVAVMAVLLLPWMVATGMINGATRGLLEPLRRPMPLPCSSPSSSSSSSTG